MDALTPVMLKALRLNFVSVRHLNGGLVAHVDGTDYAVTDAARLKAHCEAHRIGFGWMEPRRGRLYVVYHYGEVRVGSDWEAIAPHCMGVSGAKFKRFKEPNAALAWLDQVAGLTGTPEPEPDLRAAIQALGWGGSEALLAPDTDGPPWDAD